MGSAVRGPFLMSGSAYLPKHYKPLQGVLHVMQRRPGLLARKNV